MAKSPPQYKTRGNVVLFHMSHVVLTHKSRRSGLVEGVDDRLKLRLPTLPIKAYFVPIRGGAPVFVTKQHIDDQKGT